MLAYIIQGTVSNQPASDIMLLSRFDRTTLYPNALSIYIYVEFVHIVLLLSCNA